MDCVEDHHISLSGSVAGHVGLCESQVQAEEKKLQEFRTRHPQRPKGARHIIIFAVN